MSFNVCKLGTERSWLIVCSVVVLMQLCGIYWMLRHFHTPSLPPPLRLSLIVISQLVMNWGVSKYLYTLRERLHYQIVLIIAVYVFSLLLLYPLAPSVSGMNIDNTLIKQKVENIICAVVLTGFVAINVTHGLKLAYACRSRKVDPLS